MLANSVIISASVLGIVVGVLSTLAPLLRLVYKGWKGNTKIVIVNEKGTPLGTLDDDLESFHSLLDANDIKSICLLSNSKRENPRKDAQNNYTPVTV
jgi:hypothetical protein